MKHKGCAMASLCLSVFVSLGGFLVELDRFSKYENATQFLTSIFLDVLIVIAGFFLYYYLFTLFLAPFRFVYDKRKNRRK